MNPSFSIYLRRRNDKERGFEQCSTPPCRRMQNRRKKRFVDTLGSHFRTLGWVEIKCKKVEMVSFQGVFEPRRQTKALGFIH